MASATASEIVAKLKLNPHPEDKVDRPVSTSIYFLLPAGNVSRLHRIPCAETWHFYLGEPLTIMELNEVDGVVKLTNLGPNFIGEDQQPQYTVPPNFQDFELAKRSELIKQFPNIEPLITLLTFPEA
ncbi:hypothetical protein M0R45_003707 [Rubus argutus]|uniref:DUF985 domain-containing protein n=1 Tax=Rubus argutus TaxID=59490 RepID=A0AAW1YI49_RUBAR